MDRTQVDTRSPADVISADGMEARTGVVAETDLGRDRRVQASRRRSPLIVATVLLLLGVVLAWLDPTRAAVLANFVLLFESLLIGAIPLVLIGAVVAGAIAVFVPTSWFERMSGLPEWLQLPVAGLSGIAFPVCECGSIPVARRLIARGLTPSAAITFMLASPIINPIVLLSTYIAFQGRASLVAILLGRAGLGFVAALSVGWVLGGRGRGELLREPAAGAREMCTCGDDGCSHADGHHDHEHGSSHHPPTSKAEAFISHSTSELLFMARFLILGSAVAAGLQTVAPQSLLDSVAGTPIVSLVAMMGLAFVLSLCSESDAFVAASFVQFGTAPQLAFLVFGPMLDIRLALLYRATFRRGFLPLVVLVVTAVTLVGALWVGVIAG